LKILLDTHTFIWLFEGNSSLSQTARLLIEEPANDLVLSIASLWEMAIKVSTGKLIFRKPYSEFIQEQIDNYDFEVLSVTLEHLKLLSELPFHHRDPFDRLLVVQSIAESILIVSRDTVFDQYGVIRHW
jgi:PIN domain nuclease of toxin-antitoxin system